MTTFIYKTFILIYMMVIGLPTIIFSQIINGESKDVVFRSRLEIESALASSNSYEIVMDNPYYDNGSNNSFFNNGFANSDQEYEVALVYKKETQTDLNNNYWAYSLTFNLDPQPGNEVNIKPQDYNLEINNQVSEAKHEDVIKSVNTNIYNNILVKINAYNIVVQQGSLPADIYLEIRLVHKNKMNPSLLSSPALSHSVSFIQDDNYSPIGGKHQASVKWSDAKGADYYELAYTYIDEEDKNTYPNLKSRFDQSIIVETNNNWYDIDLTYPPGTLYVWVRQLFLNVDGTVTAPLEWDYENYITIPLTGFESELNWKAQSSFAEEGKSKKVLDFYDRSLRQQQTITYLNDEKVALVAETDYDLEGRASIQLLPAPAIAYDLSGQNYANNLFYKPSFNKNSNNTPFNFQNHEKLTADPVSNTAGAGQYFSPQNNSVSIHRNFIPEAGGYPMVHTKYQRDNTGRIASQSGVGLDFRLGSGHETKYFYISPSETELRAMFGGDIGEFKHYKKTITIDANGQASASYLDMTGKVIATVLLGKSPENVLALGSQGNILPKTQSLVTNQSASRKYIRSSNSFIKIGIIAENISFTYNYTGLIKSIPGYCVTCPYKVSIKLVDPCGDLVDLDGDGNKVLTINSALGSLVASNNGNCLNQNQATGSINFIATLTMEGTYTLIKEISSNFDNITQLTETAMSAINTTQIATNIAAEMDPFLCALTCDQYCRYIHPENSAGMTTCLDSCKVAFNIGQIQSQFESSCKSTLNLMANQISSGLAVFNVSGTINTASLPYLDCIHNAGDTVIIYDINGEEYLWNPISQPPVYKNKTTNTLLTSSQIIILPKYDGTGQVSITFENLSQIQNLNLLFKPQVSGSLWQEQFANALVGCHREFCHYKRCLEMKASNGFDATLSDFDDINVAFAKFNIPISSINRFNQLIDAFKNIDPFYGLPDLCPGSNQITILNDLLSNYENNFSSAIDICNYITGAPYNIPNCDYNGIMIFLSQYLSTVPDANNTSIEKTMWNIFMSSYIHFKQVISFENSCNPQNPPCIFYVDENRIYEKPITTATQNFSSFEDLYKNLNNPIPGTFNPITTITQGSVEGLLDLYETEFIPANQQTTWRVSSYFNDLKISLENYINNKCNQSSGDNYESTMQPFEGMVPFHNFCFFSGINGYTTNTYPPSPKERFTSPPVTLLSYSSNSAFLTELDDVTTNESFKSSTTEAHGIFLIRAVIGSAQERLVIKNYNNNGGSRLTHLGVRVYRSICDYENLKFITARMAGNINGDLIIDIPEDNGGDLILDIFSKDPNYSGKNLSFEFYSNFNFQVSGYFDYQQTQVSNKVHNKDLKDVFDKAKAGYCNFNSNLCATFNEVSWITKVWNCEKMCADIDPCMETIINTIKDWVETAYGTGGINPTLDTYAVSIPSSPNSCYTSIYFKHYINPSNPNSYNWWFEIVGSSILTQNQNETVMLRFVTSEGLVPNFFTNAINNTFPGQYIHNCTELNVLAYTPTSIDYSYIDLGQPSSAFVVPNIKFLLKTNIRQVTNGECSSTESLGQPYFQTAYMIIDKKNNVYYTDLIKTCDVFVDIDTLQVICREDSLALLNMLTNIEIERQKNLIVSQILSLDCISGVTETMTKTDNTYRDHHFTLYYYDQVGNLVKTIPPSGVVLTTNFDANGKWTGGNTQPAHTKATTYEYNSFNQITKSNTPDAGLTNFYYDKLQRLRFSQNAQQLQDGDVSYTLYDELGRIIETGEWKGTIATAQANIENPLWPTGEINKVDIVQTTYSSPFVEDIFGTDPPIDHGISRGRITGAKRLYPGNGVYTSFSYDSHGNVKKVFERIENLQRKEIVYEYDLISGNIKKLSFNPEKDDQYFQKYKYDSDNRLTKSYSSIDNIIWNEDARYFYYLHGPLARIEYGDDKVQGIDNIYTMQGWIKGINLHGTNVQGIEPGKDGSISTNFNTSGINARVGRDAMAFTLGYFNNDYNSINGFNFSDTWVNFGNDLLPALNGPKGLYNGNIASMITDHKGSNTGISGYAYQYDQLHRIKKAKNYQYPTVHNSYASEYSYNADGNLTSLKRYGNNGTLMDNFTNYIYPSSSFQPNTLTSVTDNVSTNTYTGDFDGTQSYTYDKIGNLISNSDMSTSITWDVYNKVNSVTSLNGTIQYKYDAFGNRVFSRKIEDFYSEKYYVRDANGNILSLFQHIDVFAGKGSVPTNIVAQKEIHLYGSSRLGNIKLNRYFSYSTNNKLIASNTLTSTHYELSNHLGNVLTTTTGRKLGIDENNNGIVDYYKPEVVQATDYYPFGSEMPGRTYKNPAFSGTNEYRFGFNGKELDKSGEFGSLTHYDYGFRIYNPSIGKFLSVDPLTKSYPMLTPYQFASNRPIDGIDLDGLEYLRADESRVELKFGELKLKVENLYFPNRRNWLAANNNPNNWNGEIGLSRSLGKVDIINPRQSTDNGATGIAQLDPDPGATDPAHNPSTNTINPRLTKQSNYTEPDRRVKPKDFQGASPGLVGKGAKGALGLSMLNMVADEYFKWTYILDKGKINEHRILAQKALNLVNNANNTGAIPPDYQSFESLLNIANVVLQGINNTTDPKIHELGLKIYNEAHPDKNKEIPIESTYKLTVTDSKKP